jgi:transcriptional regulator with XRE-family HTH domain
VDHLRVLMESAVMPVHPLSVQFGLRIRQLRQAKAMSQESFANHAGIARSYMSRIERGRAEPRFEALEKLANGLGVTLPTLFEPPTTEASAPTRSVKVPFDKDGTCFNPTLRQKRAGTFVVGEKESRQRFATFEDALTYLSRMPVAKWERPGATGRSVVTAVRWDDLPVEFHES